MNRTVKVKACGTTNVKDALSAEEMGVDFIGVLVDVPFSERSVDLEIASQIAESVEVPCVLVIYGMPLYRILIADMVIRPYAFQLLDDSPPGRISILKKWVKARIWKSIFLPPDGEESEEDLMRAIRSIEAYREAGVDAVLLDTKVAGRRGGTGRRHNWNLAAQIVDSVDLPVFLSGGINPHNVLEAIRTVRPYGIDLCSGIERGKGIRDPGKLRMLMERVERDIRRW